MPKFIAWFLSISILIGCTSLDSTPSDDLDTCHEIYGPTDSTFQQIIGTYHGMLPAHRTIGIQSTLILNKDNTVNLHCEYTDKRNYDIFNENGLFTLCKDTLSIHLEGNQQIFYLIQNQQLKMLNRNKNELTGLLKDQFIFVKE